MKYIWIMYCALNINISIEFPYFICIKANVLETSQLLVTLVQLKSIRQVMKCDSLSGYSHWNTASPKYKPNVEMKNWLSHSSLCIELGEAPSDRTSDDRGLDRTGGHSSTAMCERMFAFVSRVCDIKGLTLLVIHQVWFVRVCPAPLRKQREGEVKRKIPL